MVTFETLVAITKEEIEVALSDFVDGLRKDLTDWISAALFRPFLITIGGLGVIFTDAFSNLAQSVQRLPARIFARALVKDSDFAGKTRVVRMDEAKKFAAQLVEATVFNLAGGGPSASARAGYRYSGLKSFKKRFVATEEKQILGRALTRLLSVLRAPARFAYFIVLQVWTLISVCMAVGAIFVLWDILQSDWSKIGLSQKHPRKRMRIKINRRL